MQRRRVAHRRTCVAVSTGLIREPSIHTFVLTSAHIGAHRTAARREPPRTSHQRARSARRRTHRKVVVQHGTLKVIRQTDPQVPQLVTASNPGLAPNMRVGKSDLVSWVRVADGEGVELVVIEGTFQAKLIALE